MITIPFWKMEAAGNDFIMIDHRDRRFQEHYRHIARRLSQRRFGIGADGVIYIQDRPRVDFELLYYNADGSGPVMCGNGARAALLFVHETGICRREQYRFIAPDGRHDGYVDQGSIRLTIRKPGEVRKVSLEGETVFLVDTGVPHMVRIRDKLEQLDIYRESPQLREQFDANINYVERVSQQEWRVRTFERGVEDETWACGTGATAAAWALAKELRVSFPVTLKARGGELVIQLENDKLWLQGPAKMVFEGNIKIDLERS